MLATLDYTESIASIGKFASKSIKESLSVREGAVDYFLRFGQGISDNMRHLSWHCFRKFARKFARGVFGEYVGVIYGR